MSSKRKARINMIIAAQGLLPPHKGIKKACDLKPEHSIDDDLGADSLDRIELIMALEDDFEVDVSDEDCERWKTVGDIYEHFSS